MKFKQEGYRLSALPIIEIIGSIIIFATIFMPWMKMNGPFGISEGLKFSDKTIYIVVFGVACFANVALKFFRRSTWASVPITLCGIELLIWASRFYWAYLFSKADNDEIKMAEALMGKEIITLDIGFYLALLTSFVMLISIIRGWLTYLSNKSKDMPREWYKKSQIIALISLVSTVALVYLTKEIVVDIDCTVESFWEAYDVIIKNYEPLIPVILIHITAFLFAHYLLLALMIIEKPKDGENATEDNGTVNEDISDTQQQIDVEPVKEPTSPEPIEEPQETLLDIEQDEENDDKKKWYFIIGGIVAAIWLAVGGWWFFSHHNGNNNPLGVQKPKWEKFVMVNAIDVMLYKEADTSSPNLKLAIERFDGCMPGEKMLWEGDKVPRGYDANNYPVEINTVFPVLDENDEWYKVYIGTGEIREAYLQKKYSDEVKAEPITKEILAKVNKDVTYKLVDKGEFANLYLERYSDEMEYGETIAVGVLTDGSIVMPDVCRFCPIKSDSTGVDMRKEGYLPEYKRWNFYAPESYWKPSSYDMDGIFDVSQLKNEEIQKIVMAIRPQGETASTIYYYFPTVATDRFISFEYSFSPAAAVEIEEGKAAVTDFRVEGEKLIATVDGEDREVDLDFGNIELFGVKDLDGDGNMEAVISHFMSGANGAPVDCPFVVYYDADSDKFKKTDEMKLTYENEPTFEGSDGTITMVQREGLRMIRYAFEGGKLIVKDDEFKNVGSVVGKVTLDELFSNKEDGEKSISVDYLDDDDVTLTFAYESSGHYHGFKMALKKMEFPNGKVIDTDFSADTFKFLKEKTDGMPDFIGDNYLYRWDGSRYVSLGWDGNKFVEDWSL